MNFDRLTSDRFFAGVVLGGLFLPLIVFASEGFGKLLVQATGRDDLSQPPRTQLFALAISILVCRFLIVNLGREKTGKGFLLVVFSAALSYTYYSFHIRHAF